jgi:hypothetical protein
MVSSRDASHQAVWVRGCGWHPLPAPHPNRPVSKGDGAWLNANWPGWALRR